MREVKIITIPHSSLTKLSDISLAGLNQEEFFVTNNLHKDLHPEATKKAKKNLHRESYTSF